MGRAAKHRTPERMTTDQFYAWDGGGHLGKLELVDGVVRATAPAAVAHGSIQANLAYLLNAHLRATNSLCCVYLGSGVVPGIDRRCNVRVPDLTVTCTPLTLSDKTVPNPVLIVEVLSPSNEGDTWESIRAVATLPSLQEILVIASTTRDVLICRRQADGSWPSDGEPVPDGGTVTLVSLGAELPVAEIYRGVVL